MSKNKKEENRWKRNPSKQVTSNGRSKNTRPKNKAKRINYKKYRGQGK